MSAVVRAAPMVVPTLLAVTALPLIALDYLAADCNGLLCFTREGDVQKSLIRLSDGTTETYKPTTNWAQCGPILRYLLADGFKLSMADLSNSYKMDRRGSCIQSSYGSTPEIAIVRTFVTLRRGAWIAASSVAGLIDCEVQLCPQSR